MAEAGFDGDEVIRNREKHKCPGEEAGGGDAAVEGEREAE